MIYLIMQPDIVQVFDKIKGIITDEGWLLCHAAVVAREMNIPCIIGTRNATTLLRDGDIVQLDTMKGIVNKI